MAPEKSWPASNSLARSNMTTICATCKSMFLYGEWKPQSKYIAGPKTDSICPTCAKKYREEMHKLLKARNN